MTAPTTVDTRTDGELRAVVTRANGEVVDLGVISAEYANPLKQLWWAAVRRPLTNRRIRRFNRENLALRAAQQEGR